MQPKSSNTFPPPKFESVI